MNIKKTLFVAMLVAGVTLLTSCTPLISNESFSQPAELVGSQELFVNIPNVPNATNATAIEAELFKVASYWQNNVEAFTTKTFYDKINENYTKSAGYLDVIKSYKSKNFYITEDTLVFNSTRTEATLGVKSYVDNENHETTLNFIRTNTGWRVSDITTMNKETGETISLAEIL